VLVTTAEGDLLCPQPRVPKKRLRPRQPRGADIKAEGSAGLGLEQVLEARPAQTQASCQVSRPDPFFERGISQVERGFDPRIHIGMGDGDATEGNRGRRRLSRRSLALPPAVAQGADRAPTTGTSRRDCAGYCPPAHWLYQGTNHQKILGSLVHAGGGLSRTNISPPPCSHQRTAKASVALSAEGRPDTSSSLMRSTRGPRRRRQGFGAPRIAIGTSGRPQKRRSPSRDVCYRDFAKKSRPTPGG